MTARCRALASVAVEAGLPLAVFPAARSTTSPRTSAATHAAKTIQAIQDGTVFCVDLVCFNDDNIVINTASIGAYPTFVQTRERLEHKISKPLAASYAMLHTLRHERPGTNPFDNKTMQTSLFFIGQLDLPAVRLRTVAAHPHGRRAARRADPGDRPPLSKLRI